MKLLLFHCVKSLLHPRVAIGHYSSSVKAQAKNAKKSGIRIHDRIHAIVEAR